MKIDASIKVNLRTKEVTESVKNASRIGLRDGIVLMAADSVKPPSPVRTGNNRRSMTYEVSGFGAAKPLGGIAQPEIVDQTKLQAALYSTSGYGGFLETGTNKMNAQPYIRPAFDRHKDKIPILIKEALEKNER